MQTHQPTPSTHKVRRDYVGGKRGDGHRRKCRIRRADPGRIHVEASDENLTAFSGLVEFGTFLHSLGVDASLRERFSHLKVGSSVKYPMEAQLRMLIDAAVVGECRVFGIEALSADPLFVHLAGGVIPSIDTIYRDLRRFDDAAISDLESMMAFHGLAEVKNRRHHVLHLDVDTTVEPLFGEHEGVLPGYNPRFPGRGSYHPVLARCAEVDTVVGAKLRPGNTSFGDNEAPLIGLWIDRLREAAGAETVIYTRIDSAGDCAQVMRAINEKGSHFLIKAKTSGDLGSAICRVPKGCWRTVDVDADGKPTQQVAEVDFARAEWSKQGINVRVVAVRSNERNSSNQLYLWEDSEWSVQAYLTNDNTLDAAEIAQQYNGRAGIEPLIAELKGSWGIGQVPSASFIANHADLLIKLLTRNLLRRYVLTTKRKLGSWRAQWLRHVLLVVPGRLIRHGRRTILRVPPRPHFLN